MADNILDPDKCMLCGEPWLRHSDVACGDRFLRNQKVSTLEAGPAMLCNFCQGDKIEGCLDGVWLTGCGTDECPGRCIDVGRCCCVCHPGGTFDPKALYLALNALADEQREDVA